ncbi:hypothetical protein JR316_0005813 [Psilocybe cubensis]|uniref:Uncharacterized protein n=2 Tax=Psilocybe cubensis TaxID=181762 RepID=A0ACB8H0D0_PSICU|nr:hypothetical protein JR316_0005813 [Psilocybe cubensis]KAH9481291.1 hypothetical protein JR316_0005813 [Psilocybe cubensis]
MECGLSNVFPVSANRTLEVQLAQSFSQSLDVKIDNSTLLSSSFLWVLYCAADTAQHCHGICPNADLAGVGVRTAFWLSSILQAILVAVSPEESTQGAWTAAILTASVTIPALIQKRNRQLSIYHATLVLNFATFSSIVSLAVAPMCTVWRPAGDPELPALIFGEEGRTLSNDAEPLTNLPKNKVHRQRLVLSLALLTQVALQWAWTITLFTDPEYYQKACIPSTIVVLFGRLFSVQKINHGQYIIWPLWLLFNLAITLIWGVLLVYSSSPSVHPVLSRSPSRLDLPLTWRDKLPQDKGRIMVIISNFVAFLISLLLLVSSEVQVARNCVHDENSDWSFGQIAAILVALAPAWSIVTALDNHHKPQMDDRTPIHNDVESEQHTRDLESTSVLASTDGRKTPIAPLIEEVQETISIDEEPSYSYHLTVPRDAFRQRAPSKPPPSH